MGSIQSKWVVRERLEVPTMQQNKSESGFRHTIRMNIPGSY